MMTCVLIREDRERGRKIAELRRRPREDGAESGVLLLGARTPQEDGGGPEGFSLRDFAGAGVCCQHPNFRLLPSRSLRKNISLALSHRHVFGNFDINPRKLIHFQSLILIENSRYVISLMHDFFILS